MRNKNKEPAAYNIDKSKWRFQDTSNFVTGLFFFCLIFIIRRIGNERNKPFRNGLHHWLLIWSFTAGRSEEEVAGDLIHFKLSCNKMSLKIKKRLSKIFSLWIWLNEIRFGILKNSWRPKKQKLFASVDVCSKY